MKKMELKKIQYNDETFVVRVVLDKYGEELLIGNYSLLDTLQPYDLNNETNGLADDQAKEIYDTIFYFVDNNTLWGDESELIEELKTANPDFFN